MAYQLPKTKLLDDPAFRDTLATLQGRSKSKAAKRQRQITEIPKPSEAEMKIIKMDLWLTVISSSHPQTAAAIENHFWVDNGYRLEAVSASLGFRTSEGFLCSEYCSDFIHQSIAKDELDEFGTRKFSTLSFNDITHVTNIMSESAICEEEREARKQYFKLAKYSTEEFKEKAIEMREQIAICANDIMEETSTNKVSWEQIQVKYKEKYGESLTKKHLRTAFPTGHPSKIIEQYMHEEFTLHKDPSFTGGIFIKFRQTFCEVLEMYEEAREALQNPTQVLKAPEFRTKENTYVDYVRERQKRDVYLQKKAEETEDIKKIPSNHHFERRLEAPKLRAKSLGYVRQKRDVYLQKKAEETDELSSYQRPERMRYGVRNFFVPKVPPPKRYSSPAHVVQKPLSSPDTPPKLYQRSVSMGKKSLYPPNLELPSDIADKIKQMSYNFSVQAFRRNNIRT